MRAVLRCNFMRHFRRERQRRVVIEGADNDAARVLNNMGRRLAPCFVQITHVARVALREPLFEMREFGKCLGRGKLRKDQIPIRARSR